MGLGDEIILQLCSIVVPMLAAKDQIVIEEGLVGQEMYIIVHGEVVVEKNGVRLGFLSTGAFFGETPIIHHDAHAEVRTRTVRAVAETELIYLQRHKVLELQRQTPELKLSIRRFARIGSHIRRPRMKRRGTTLAGERQPLEKLQNTVLELTEELKLIKESVAEQMQANKEEILHAMRELLQRNLVPVAHDCEHDHAEPNTNMSAARDMVQARSEQRTATPTRETRPSVRATRGSTKIENVLSAEVQNVRAGPRDATVKPRVRFSGVKTPPRSRPEPTQAAQEFGNIVL